MNLQARLQDILARKKQAECPLQVLTILAGKAPAYDLARNLALLSDWLAPYAKSTAACTDEQFALLNNWKVLALARHKNCSPREIVAAIIQENHNG